jgi:lipid-binding SYLF domain-containing protein
MKVNSLFVALVLGFASLALVGCPTTPRTEEAAEKLDSAVSTTLADMRAEAPDFGEFLDRSYAYAVFPTVGEGAFVFGAGGGRGEVYEQGKMIGYSRMIKGTVGAQIGGKGYAQVVCFENKAALDKFIAKEFAFSAEVSAVALKSGAAKMAKFQNGIAVFQYQKGGLMAAAAVGGQQFTYAPAR